MYRRRKQNQQLWPLSTIISLSFLNYKAPFHLQFSTQTSTLWDMLPLLKYCRFTAIIRHTIHIISQHHIFVIFVIQHCPGQCCSLLAFKSPLFSPQQIILFLSKLTKKWYHPRCYPVWFLYVWFSLSLLTIQPASVITLWQQFKVGYSRVCGCYRF